MQKFIVAKNVGQKLPEFSDSISNKFRTSAVFLNRIWRKSRDCYIWVFDQKHIMKVFEIVESSKHNLSIPIAPFRCDWI